MGLWVCCQADLGSMNRSPSAPSHPLCSHYSRPILGGEVEKPFFLATFLSVGLDTVVLS